MVVALLLIAASSGLASAANNAPLGTPGADTLIGSDVPARRQVSLVAGSVTDPVNSPSPRAEASGSSAAPTPLLVAEGVQFFFAIPATFETLRLPANLGLYGRLMYGVRDAAELKQAVDVPVVANGRLGDPADAVGVMERGEADAIGLAAGA